MPETLYLSDLDGTLLNAQKRLSAYTLRSLNERIEGGLAFTYATARSFTSARVATEGLRLRLPVITYNGAFIVDPSTGTPIVKHMLDRDAIEPLLRRIREERIPSLFYAYIGGEERVSYRPADVNRQVAEYLDERKGDKRMRAADTFDALFEGDLFYITVLTDRETSVDLVDRVRSIDGCDCLLQRDIYGERFWWLEINHRDASKSFAARTLCRMYGFERLVCFGDNLNDLSMFNISDECYAVRNADPQVLRAATGVIGGNDEDGVARWIEALPRSSYGSFFET